MNTINPLNKLPRLNRLVMTLALALSVMFLLTDSSIAEPLGTNWTYQGRVTDGGEPVNGTIDLRFVLFDAVSNGTPVGLPQILQDVPVVNGVFTVELDFGAGPFNGDARWLAVSMRPGVAMDPVPFTSLSPRQPLTVAPYAQTATKALSADAVTGVDGHSLNAADGLPVDVVYVANNGDVGIGTTTPSEKLTVSQGNLRADRGTQTINQRAMLTLNGARVAGGNPFATVQFSNYDDDSSQVDYIGAEIRSHNDDDADSGDLRFFTKATNDVDPLQRMKITPVGDVGIGTSNPASKLDVAGTITANAFVGDGSGLTGIGASDGHSLDAADGAPIDAVYVNDDGLVGIGTTTPVERLHISANAPELLLEASGSSATGLQFKNADYGYSIRMTNNEKFVLRDLTAGNVDRLTIDQTGFVGIGISNPETPLSISNGGLPFGLTQGQMGGNGMELTTRDGGTNQSTRLWIEGGFDDPAIHFLSGARTAETVYASFEDNGIGGQFRLSDSTGVNRVRARSVGDGGELQIYDAAGNDMATVDVVSNGGRLVLTDPAGIHRVNAQATADGGQVEVRNIAGDDRASMYVSNADAGTINTRGPSGNINVQLGTSSDPDHGSLSIRDEAGTVKALMQVDGSGSGLANINGPNGNLNINLTFLDVNQNHGFIGVHGASGVRKAAMFVNELGQGEVETDVLQLLGGADIAEPFDINADQEVKPGMVVSIDPANAGQLRLATNAYDTTVAGVISGAGGVNPAMTLQQKGTIADGDMPVALTGRVYVFVDAALSPVKPGDLLTTSNTPGHAMKVTDHDRAHGAIIGKAMTSLESGKGLVLVLVSLH